MITAITCSMLESLSTSDDDQMNTCDYISTLLEPKTKHLMKETLLDHRPARPFVRRGHNIRVKIYVMENFTLKAMIGRSRYNTTTKRSREECF